MPTPQPDPHTPVHRTGDPPGSAGDGSDGDDASGGDASSLVNAVMDAVARTGTISAAGASDAVEGAARSLTRRVVTAAVDDPADVGEAPALVQALSAGPRTPLVGSAAVAAVAARAAARFRPFAFLSRRTPLWLMAAGVPALVTSVSRGVHELSLVASHLTRRARAAGVTPDPERVRRAAVQIVAHRTIDPEAEPGHGRLVAGWVRRAARGVVPMSRAVTTDDPEGIAARAAGVDPRSLGPG